MAHRVSIDEYLLTDMQQSYLDTNAWCFYRNSDTVVMALRFPSRRKLLV